MDTNPTTATAAVQASRSQPAARNSSAERSEPTASPARSAAMIPATNHRRSADAPTLSGDPWGSRLRTVLAPIETDTASPHPNPARILEKESFFFKNDKSSRGPGRLTARTDLTAGSINV